MLKEAKIKNFFLNIILNYPKFFFKKGERFIYFYKLKLARLPATSYSISAGFACGSMVSFTPLLGFHFLLAIVISFLIRGNVIAALIGTFIGNPLTFPFIWSLIYNVGIYLTSDSQEILNSEISVDMILNQTYQIFIPMLVGGAVLSLPIWFITFLVVYSFISSYKKSKAKKKLKVKKKKHNNSKDL